GQRRGRQVEEPDAINYRKQTPYAGLSKRSENFYKAGQSYPLSPRERAGVRGKEALQLPSRQSANHFKMTKSLIRILSLAAIAALPQLSSAQDKPADATTNRPPAPRRFASLGRGADQPT